MAENTEVHYRQGGQKVELPNNYERSFDDLIRILQIKDYFPDFDEDLLKFAFYGDGLFGAKICYYENDLLERLRRKYCLDICDNRILESHGDVVLNTIVGNKLLHYFKLSLSPKQYHVLIRDITSNYDLTAIAYDIGVCRYLGIPNAKEVTDKHNVCANCMENLLGALFYGYGLEGLKTIQEWFFSFPIVLAILGLNLRATVKKYNLEEKVACAQQYRRNILDFFVMTDLPCAYGHLSNDPDRDIDYFIDSTGYLIEEETTTDRMRLVLTDPQKRFKSLVLITRLGPSKLEQDDRFKLYAQALGKLVASGFWIVPLTREAVELRKRVNRNDAFDPTRRN